MGKSKLGMFDNIVLFNKTKEEEFSMSEAVDEAIASEDLDDRVSNITSMQAVDIDLSTMNDEDKDKYYLNDDITTKGKGGSVLCAHKYEHLIDDKFKECQRNIDDAIKKFFITYNFNKRLSDLSKNKEDFHSLCINTPSLWGLNARVAIVIDYSGSMKKLYEDGTVQKMIDKLLPVSIELDKNNFAEVWLFDDSYRRLSPVSMDNFEDYIVKEVLEKNIKPGGTKYAPVMQDVIERYTLEENPNIPSLVIYITDGDNIDKNAATNALTNASKIPIFWQFIGIGDEKLTYLSGIHKIRDRYVNNSGFIKVDDFEYMSYSKLINGFTNWLNLEKVKEMISTNDAK